VILPRVVKFDPRPQLDALIDELTETFAVRYEKPPSTKDLQALEDARVANVLESVHDQFTSLELSEHLDDLAAPSWFVDTFRRISIQIFGRPQTKLESSPLVQDLVRNGRGSRASWECGFRAQSLRGFLMVVDHVVGHESVDDQGD